ncbi:anthranilate synthase component I [Mesocricetibacter intestinalis]|uniref:Anthranilate synthase component 1 n=1 Tax=Mesocricetibacter intestinalis TaxID=1521930 RepID=A0A4R6VEZ9_9PAST|nr:anthranilate synthase component I [Mesocricetibacter intestinalis]TDQ59080.1 anthranilate synthase component I [Mesocricetibacter intestinalis]
MSPAYIQTSCREVDYHEDPSALFATLCQNQPNTLLLESAEISSKNSLKSLLLINSAMKIHCRGDLVCFIALSENATPLLKLIAAELQEKAQTNFCSPQRLEARFFPLDANLDEDSKLMSSTVFDGLRIINNLYRHSEVPVFLGGLFAYDLVANFIPLQEISLRNDGLSCPDYVFYLAEHLLQLDHPNRRAKLQSFCFNPQQLQPLTLSADQIAARLQHIQALPKLRPAPEGVKVYPEDEEFKQIITKLKSHIYKGDVFQIVPSRRFSLSCPNPLASYHQLKHNNPSPYMFFMQDEEFILFGASPESALKYEEEKRQLEIYPIAGSRPRGFDRQGNIDPELDARLELELRLDHKEQAEHLMLVDLARNDVARVCESGSRRVEELMQVDRYSMIMHLVSRVVGKLRPELDALHAYQACMNMGTLTGAPKIKAMQLIYRFEGQKRHSYGGAVGYLTSDGNLDTCIVIRSAFVQQGIAYIQAGCGEVLDSDPQAEADETRHKAAAVIKAIQQTNQRAGNE